MRHHKRWKPCFVTPAHSFSHDRGENWQRIIEIAVCCVPVVLFAVAHLIDGVRDFSAFAECEEVRMLLLITDLVLDNLFREVLCADAVIEEEIILREALLLYRVHDVGGAEIIRTVFRRVRTPVQRAAHAKEGMEVVEAVAEPVVCRDASHGEIREGAVPS